MKKRLFEITAAAKADLIEILTDIAEDSPGAARRVQSAFLEGLKALAKSPGIGHYHDEFLSRKYRFWNFHAYIVAYEWEAKPIRIIGIAHGSRLLGYFFAARARDN